MALRATRHRALVYFGLAEDEEAYAEPVRDRDRDRERERPTREPEAEMEDTYRERPNVRRLSRRRRDDFDDIFADESPRGGGRGETRVLRPVETNGRANGGDLQVHLVVPKSFNDAQQIA